MYFCFLSYSSFWRGCSVRKDKHTGWLIIEAGTSSANNTGFIHHRSCLRDLLFFASIFSLSGLKRKTEYVMVRRPCAWCKDRVLSKKWQAVGCGCCQGGWHCKRLAPEVQELDQVCQSTSKFIGTTHQSYSVLQFAMDEWIRRQMTLTGWNKKIIWHPVTGYGARNKVRKHLQITVSDCR